MLMKSKKKQFRVDIDAGLCDEIDRYFDRVGSSRVVGTERIMHWFLSLPETVRARVVLWAIGIIALIAIFKTLGQG